MDPGVYGSKNRSSRLKEPLVDVAPDPLLTRLEGLNDRVVGSMEMLGGVLILRIVTATDMSTGETEAQVHPGITHFQAFLASIGAWRDLSYLIEMATVLCHVFVLSLTKWFTYKLFGKKNYVGPRARSSERNS